jgi:hypothetical protein
MRPPLPGMPSKERCFDREHFTWQRILCQNPAHEEAGKVPVGEPSLSGEPECLVLFFGMNEKVEIRICGCLSFLHMKGTGLQKGISLNSISPTSKYIMRGNEF